MPRGGGAGAGVPLPRAECGLSAIAKEIAGTPWNGFTFFGLGKERVDGQG
ncbi:MAG: DUF2924 domain-containing protein [Holophagaceae bacterium]|nr:DUF2924 domain-containing protein [Holophagaceae bacterium]